MKKKRIDFSELDECSVIVNHIYQMRHCKGLGTTILTTGLSGTGKSSVDQRLAELISIKIHGENIITPDDIVDSLLEFLGRLRKVTKKGEIIIIEEVGVLFPSRRAMSVENVDMAKVLDTVRKKQVILITNAPIFKSIDSHLRSMGHILIETIRINMTQEVVVFKSWKLQTNPHTGKTYRHTMSRNGRDVTRFFTKKPNEETWDAYEKKKDEFMCELYDNLKHRAKMKQDKLNKEKGKDIPLPKEISKKELHVYDLYYNQQLTQTEIAKRRGVTPSAINHMLKNIQEKTEYNKENRVNELNKPQNPALN